MFGSQILDVGIGLFLIYLLMSIVCSAIREGMEGYLKTRAKFLERGIRELLNGDVSGGNLAADIYNHPLVYGLFPGAYKPESSTAGQPAEPAESAESGGYWFSTNLPSYIPAGNFAAALLDRVARGPVSSNATGIGTKKLDIASVRQNIATIGNPQVTRALLAALDAADDDLVVAQKNVEAWYNSAMDRVSGWYKRRTQLVLLVLGLLVTVLANVNSLTVARHLYHDQAARQALVGRAQTLDRNTVSQGMTFESLNAELAKMQLPVGWSDPRVVGTLKLSGPEDVLNADLWRYVGSSFLGWLITALAISLGAPFWFDVLNKVMVIRSTVKPHEKSLEEASEDRQKTKK